MLLGLSGFPDASGLLSTQEAIENRGVNRLTSKTMPGNSLAGRSLETRAHSVHLGDTRTPKTVWLFS